jgi:hypothetical protein
VQLKFDEDKQKAIDVEVLMKEPEFERLVAEKVQELQDPR